MPLTKTVMRMWDSSTTNKQHTANNPTVNYNKSIQDSVTVPTKLR